MDRDSSITRGAASENDQVRVEVVSATRVNTGDSVAYVNVREFGAKGDGVTDDTVAIQSILTSATNGTTIIFPKGTYLCSGTLRLGTLKKKITIIGYGAKLVFSNTGDGLTIASENLQYDQNHRISGLEIKGPNTVYPSAGYVPVSNGAGLNMDRCYSCVIKDVTIYGFNYGLYTTTGVGNVVEGYSYFYGNQYGIYIGVGTFNANIFKDVKVRENRKQGIHMEGGNSEYHVFNVFEHCFIESNIPWPLVTTTPPNNGVGVYISKAYDTQFNNCYFENSTYYVYFYTRAYDTRFTNCYFSSNGKTVAYFNGPYMSRTQFVNCHHYSTNSNTPSLESNAIITDTVLMNCVGFNIISSAIANSDIDLLRCKKQVAGTEDGTINIPSTAILINPAEGTTRGTIQGIGTAAATLDAQGYGDITFGTLITTDTTITRINGLKKGQFLVLYKSVSSGGVVTIKSGGRNGAIILQNDVNCVLKNRGDMIVFWVNYTGYAVEVMRNITPSAAPPTTGTWQLGATVTNSTPAPGGYMGWVCTTAGSPGIWRGFGLISST